MPGLGFAVVKLFIIGALLGGGLACVLKYAQRRAQSGKTKNKEAAAAEHRLIQLKSRLDSGLITKEEYKAEKQKILKER